MARSATVPWRSLRAQARNARIKRNGGGLSVHIVVAGQTGLAKSTVTGNFIAFAASKLGVPSAFIASYIHRCPLGA